MKQLGKEQINFLLIEIEELKELTQAISEVGGVTPSLYKLAYEKARRIYNTLKPTNELSETMCTHDEPISNPQMEKKPQSTPIHCPEPQPKPKITPPVVEVMEPLVHPSLSEIRPEELANSMEADNEPSLFTQPIIIQTATAPTDLIEPTAILNERITSITTSLSEALQRKNAADLRRAFSLNDRFRFQRELFDNSADEMENALIELNSKENLEEAIAYLLSDLRKNPDDETVKEFIVFLEKRFS